MIIKKAYKDRPTQWMRVSLEECLEKTEGRGHYAIGTVRALLEAGARVSTPYAVYVKEESGACTQK